MKPTDFSETISNFLHNYLKNERGYSRNTVKSYRDTWKLLISFMNDKKNIKVEKLRIKHLTKETVLEFLYFIEFERNCSIQTRNVRLAAIKSYLSYIQYIDIENLHETQKIQSIKSKKFQSKLVEYLSIDAIKELLKQPDLSTKKGIRDLALLSLLYESGARVQEIIDLTPSMIDFKKPYSIQIIGKGNQTRNVPIVETQIKNLKHYMNILKIDKNEAHHPLFYNCQKEQFSSQGIRVILERNIIQARKNTNVIFPKNVSPHTIRHSRAVHLLSFGVPLYIIRDILGHSSVITTEKYAKVEMTAKRKAIEKANKNVSPTETSKWLDDSNLLTWLNEL
ncbi:tyrosine-type recombinase/integrase [Maribacter sp. Asnod1-A12]|uniref:tyrosine-type recombinase/integrase n=1 Tax=Maribacter sp. Asnod1-A12 TaxID=3160576 RepID=UPI003867497B